MSSRPLEVLHVVESLGEGGAEQNLLSFLKHLDRDAYRHHIAWLYPDERLIERFRPHAASLTPLSASKHLGLLTAAWRLAAVIRRVRPDVVHTQLVRAQLVARLATVLAGSPPLVTTWQAAYYETVSDFAGSKRRRSAVRLLDRLTSGIDRQFIAVSQYVAEHCERELHIDRGRVRVIYNAVDPSRYSVVERAAVARARDALGLAADARVLLNVGRLVEQKSQRDAIAAMPAILARVPKAVLLIAGRGPLGGELQRQANELGVANAVKLLGARDDVPVLYQLAHLFVFPSVSEGLSVAVLEALANGLPAVVSDIPQNREIASGLPSVRFVPVRQPDAIAAAVVALLSGYDAEVQAARSVSGGLQQRFSPSLLARQFGETLAHAAFNE